MSLFVLSTLLSVPSPAGAVAAPTANCTVVAADDGNLQVEWEPVGGATGYVVYRSVDGSRDHWRGRTTDLHLLDTDRAGSLQYSIVVISATGERSAATACTDSRAVGTPAAPTACVVTTPTTGTLEITWSPASGAAHYIVSRSVDGGPRHWRGRTAQTSFTDTDRPAELQYSIVAVSSNGLRSTAAPCSDERAAMLEAPASCEIVRLGPATLDIRWSAAGGAVDYLVYRSVNGSGAYWRARTSALHQVDDDRVGMLTYTVVAESATGERSPATPCTQEVPDEGVIDLLAVGDMVQCSGGGAQRVADLLGQLPGRILGLGDFAYESGSAVEFENCFDPIFGGHRDRFDPVPGNHEYDTPGAVPYFDYFGDAAGDPSQGYYALQVGNWQILGLNSNCSEVGGCDAASPQGRWLDQQLAQAPAGVCRIAFMHHPRFTSYAPYDNARFVEPLHEQLFDAGTDLVLSGHSHHYERFAPMRPDGTVDLESGITNITVGTGGVPRRTNLTPRPLSQVRITDAWGVLDLDLRDHDYSWRFVDVEGRILDSGTETCIAAR